VHHPREILRIERDYTGGEVIQFSPSYPLELEGRVRAVHSAYGVGPCVNMTLTQVTPTQFLESINLINEVLISAHSLQPSFVDNMLAVFTLQLSRHVLTSHYEKVNINLLGWFEPKSLPRRKYEDCGRSSPT
jgi:hypothetical protein